MEIDIQNGYSRKSNGLDGSATSDPSVLLTDVRPRKSSRRPTSSTWRPERIYDPPEPPTEEQKLAEQAQLEQAARIGQEARGRARIKPRKTVDYFAPIIRERLIKTLRANLDNVPTMRPTSTYVIDLLLPSAYPSNSSLGLTTRYTHPSTNKIRTPINCVTWTPEGRRVLTGANSGEFTMWNGLTFNFETIVQAHDSPVRAMEWSHSGNWLVSGDDLGTLKYSHPNLNNLQSFQGHPEAVRDISFSPNDTRFVTGGDDTYIRVWSFEEMREEKTWIGHGWDVRCVKWHPTKGLLVSGGKDAIVKFWDPRTTKVLQSLHGHKHHVQALAWNPNGNTVATASRDTFVKVYDIRLMKELVTLRGHKKDVCSLAWHPIHHDQLVSGGGDGSLLHWSIDSSSAFSMSNQDEGGRDAAAMRVATALSSFSSSTSMAPIETIEYAHDANIWSLAYHPLGHMLVSGSSDNTTRFWSRNRPSGGDGKGGAGFGGLGGGKILNDRFHVGRDKAKELAGGVEALDDDDHDIPLPGLGANQPSFTPSTRAPGLGNDSRPFSGGPSPLEKDNNGRPSGPNDYHRNREHGGGRSGGYNSDRPPRGGGRQRTQRRWQ